MMEESDYIVSNYYTQLAVGLLFPTFLEIVRTVKERDFDLAYTLFTIFVNAHPPDVRDEVFSKINENEADEKAREKIEEMYGLDFERVMDETALRPAARREYEQQKARYMLIQGTRALGEAWARHGLVWFRAKRGWSL